MGPCVPCSVAWCLGLPHLLAQDNMEMPTRTHTDLEVIAWISEDFLCCFTCGLHSRIDENSRSVCYAAWVQILLYWFLMLWDCLCTLLFRRWLFGLVCRCDHWLGCFKIFHQQFSEADYIPFQHFQDGAKSDKEPKMFSAVHAFASLVVTDPGSLDLLSRSRSE